MYILTYCRFLYSFLLLTYTRKSGAGNYWSEDYDSGKNCQKEDVIAKIQSGTDNTGRCAVETGDLSDSEVFDRCKLSLVKVLGTLCGLTSLQKAGELLYCKNQKTTICCFHGYKCSTNWTIMQEDDAVKAIEFLTNTTEVLNKEKARGYASCHPLSTSMDASVCQSDCKNYESSDFAEQCKQKEGFFKCCVRRDHALCNECRFCCTLLMCTMKTGKSEKTVFTSFETENNTAVNISTDPGLGQAKELFTLLSSEEGDYRCLNPTSDGDPSKWGSYDPQELAKATSKEELDKVLTYPFDKRFRNLEDPEVIKVMSGKDFRKNWKEVYGFDFLSFKGDYSEVLLDCYEAEKSDFAKKCRKNKGFFKCCASVKGQHQILKIRKELKKLDLIDDAHEELCPDPEKCKVSMNVHICAKMNPYSGLVSLDFRTPLVVNPLNGFTIPDAQTEAKIESNTTNLRLGYRIDSCLSLDTCLVESAYFKDNTAFMQAADQKSFCKLELWDKGEPSTASDHSKAGETYEECLKRKHPNIRICSKDQFEKKNVTKYGFKAYDSAMKQLWSKPKKKSSKKKKKKKNSKVGEKKKKKTKPKKKKKKDKGKKKKKTKGSKKKTKKKSKKKSKK